MPRNRGEMQPWGPVRGQGWRDAVDTDILEGMRRRLVFRAQRLGLADPEDAAQSALLHGWEAIGTRRRKLRNCVAYMERTASNYLRKEAMTRKERPVTADSERLPVYSLIGRYEDESLLDAETGAVNRTNMKGWTVFDVRNSATRARKSGYGTTVGLLLALTSRVVDEDGWWDGSSLRVHQFMRDYHDAGDIISEQIGTELDRRVMKLVVAGFQQKQIASALAVSKGYVSRIVKKWQDRLGWDESKQKGYRLISLLYIVRDLYNSVREEPALFKQALEGHPLTNSAFGKLSERDMEGLEQVARDFHDGYDGWW